MVSPNYVQLFQYGSNMDADRLNAATRLDGLAIPGDVVRLEGFGIRFNLYSKANGCGVTNMVKSTTEHIIGILYKVPSRCVIARRGVRSLMDKIEGARRANRKGSYKRVWVEVEQDGRKVKAITYVGTYYGRTHFERKSNAERQVHKKYFGHLIRGAEKFHLGSTYTNYLRKCAGTLKG